MRAIAFPGQSDPRFCPRTRVIAFSGWLEFVQWRVRKQERKARREGGARFSLTAGFLPRSSSCAATEGDLRFWEAYLRLPFHSAAFSQAPRFPDIEGACDALPPQSPRFLDKVGAHDAPPPQSPRFLDNGGACGSLPRSREDQGPAKVILAGVPTTPLLRNRPDSWTTGASAAPLRNLGDSLPEPHGASPRAARRMDLGSPCRSPNGPRLPIPLTEHDAKRFVGESTLNNCFVTSDESAMSRIAQGLRSAATGDLRRPRLRGLHGDGIGIPRRLKLRALRGIEPGALRRREPSRFERRRARALGACAPAFRHHAGERNQHVQNLQQSQQVRPGSR